MEKYIITANGRKAVSALLEKLEDYVTDLEELQSDLSDYAEAYMDDMEDMLNQADQCLQETSWEHRINHMLRRELNAERKELLSLLKLLEKNGIQPPEEPHIDYRRLDPELYEQDPESPFYILSQDEHFDALLAGQLNELVQFEEYTPMTTTERNALQDYVIRRTGFGIDPEAEWGRFLDELRNGAGKTTQEGW